MPIRALHTAGTGMQGTIFNLDVVANNLANASTTAFKRSRTNFEDLYYEHIKIPGAQDSQGLLSPLGISVGLGTRVASTQLDFSEGSLMETGRSLDVAIVGDGFFQVQDGQQPLYTRSGTFTLNADGQIVLASADRGRLLDPPIDVPIDATEIVISSDGFVSVRTPATPNLTPLQQIQLVRFVNPEGLLQMGENLFSETDASGQPLQGNPGQDGLGTLRQGFLEASNVEPVRELVDLIQTQRNFELNSQLVQAADQAMALIANLRRF